MKATNNNQKLDIKLQPAPIDIQYAQIKFIGKKILTDETKVSLFGLFNEFILIVTYLQFTQLLTNIDTKTNTVIPADQLQPLHFEDGSLVNVWYYKDMKDKNPEQLLTHLIIDENGKIVTDVAKSLTETTRTKTDVAKSLTETMRTKTDVANSLTETMRNKMQLDSSSDTNQPKSSDFDKRLLLIPFLALLAYGARSYWKPKLFG